MMLTSRRCQSCVGLLALAVVFWPSQPVRAQNVLSDRGFDYKAEARASGDERNSQQGLWVLEVQYKTLRMIFLDLTDLKTGKKKKELIWYFVYKALNRPVEGQQDDSDKEPVNQFDKPQSEKPVFAPEFTLVTNDNGAQNIYQDEILPEALAAIIKRERQDLKNSVEVVGTIPDPTPFEAARADENVVYGVAMWRGVTSKTDYFTVFLSGFSNGFRYVHGPVSYDQLVKLANSGDLLKSDNVWDGKADWVTAGNIGGLFDSNEQPLQDVDASSWFYTSSGEELDLNSPPMVWRKTLSLEYWRPGDRFRQDETEVRPRTDPKWVYRISEPPAASLSASQAKQTDIAPTNPPEKSPPGNEEGKPDSP